MTPADPTWAEGFVAGAGLMFVVAILVVMFIAKILSLPGEDPDSRTPNSENHD